MMKIGIDGRMSRSSTAGIGRYSQNLIKNLLEIDHENQYMFFMTDEDEKEFKVQKSKFKMTNQNVKIKLTNISHYSLAEQTKLAGIIAREKCDLVHFLNFNHPVRYKGKFIVTIHDLTLLFYPEAARKTNFAKQWAFRYILKKACQNAAKIIAVSENTKNDIIKTFQVAPEKISVIYEAADDPTSPAQGGLRGASKKFNCHSELVEESPVNTGTRTSREILRLTAQDDKPIILYVGQFRRHKNIEGLLKAFAIVKKDIPSKLVLLGKVPTNFKIDNKALLRDTLMPGFVSDEELATWYKLASVFVFPSFYEGFGLPGLEAMAAGVPVVSSNRSSLPEIYQDAALYFNPLKPQEIADKIKLVLKNDKLRESLIEKGKIIAGKYSWEKTARETLKIYKEILMTKS